MINFVKKRWKQATLIILAFIMVLSLPITTFADEDMHDYIPPASNIGSVQDILRDEAHAQLAMFVLSECIGGGVNRDEAWSGVTDHTTWFNRSWDDKTINTGYWYEKQLQGEFDDGRIKCSDSGTSPVQIAAELIGVSSKDIFCNGDSSGVAKNKDGYTCGSSSGKYTRNGNNGGDGATGIDRGSDGTFSGQAWSTHLQNLFDAKGAEQKWEHTYVEIGHYYQMVGYYLYRTEIEIKCGGVTETLNSKPSDMEMVLTDVTQDGEQAGKVVYKRYNQNSSFSHEFVNNDYVGSCSTMIARANDAEMYGSYRDRLIATLNRKCKEDIDTRKAEAEATGVELNEETIAAYNAAVADTSNYNIGQFVKGNETDGWQCADIGDFEGATQSDPTGDDIDDDDMADPDCYTNAASLGWILCPIINQGGEFVTMIYEKMIEPFLVLDSGLFDRGEKGGQATYNAWTQFQTYANVAFIALFLFVIFSQLTGYGIDNYGIKKILPKLIVAAILINLSYIICQLAVDVANILGYGMKSILDNIGKVNLDGLTMAEAPTTHPGMAAGATAILVALVALITVPAILSQGTAILVPVFIAIIGIVIAVFTLFCLLAVRKAFAVVLVVISPMAFLCYMLPNTKKLFDKWFTAFKATLIAFPICSAMVYGGQAVARILVQASGETNMPFLVVLSAAVMSIAPVFLIPGTLRKSMGAISGMIDKVSRGASGRARAGVRNSNVARDLQRRGQLQRSGIKVDKDGNVKYTARGKLQNKFTKGNAAKQRLASARADAIKSMSSAAAYDDYMGEKGLNKMDAAYSSAQVAQSKQHVADLEAKINTSPEANDIGALQGKLTEAIKSGDVDAVKAYQNVLTKKGEPGRQAVRQAMLDTKGTTGDAYKEGVKAYSQNIMENHQSAYKEKDRSVYEFAKNAQATGTGMISDSINTSKLTGESISGMDDDAFARLQNQGIDTNMQSAAYAALHSEGANKMESGRRTALENMVQGYTPPDAAASGTPAPSSNPAPSGSGSDWSNMTQEQKRFIQRSNPRREGESTAEWAARIQQETGFSIGKNKSDNA